MFGSHLSIAGGLHNALLEARTLGMDCVQVFTGNPRSWPKGAAPARLIDPEQIQTWNATRQETQLQQVVSHDSYLINLASPSPAVLQQSLEAFRREMRRCEELAIPWLVMHPGAHMGEGEDAGLLRVAEAFNVLHADMPDLRVVTCLEITAGQGSTLGYRFEHLRRIIDHVRQPQRMGVCLDTAHLLAAGYDLTSDAGMTATLQECDEVLGLAHVRVLHLNDSKTPRGSRVDRHEHIGQGHVALPAFAALLNHPVLGGLPKILETPKEKAPDGREWDTVNLQTLKGLLSTPKKPARKAAAPAPTPPAAPGKKKPGRRTNY